MWAGHSSRIGILMNEMISFHKLFFYYMGVMS